MRRFALVSIALALLTTAGLARQSSDGPYKVLKTAKVGGEGGADYIYADVAGRRLCIPRGSTRAVPATATARTPAVLAASSSISTRSTRSAKSRHRRRQHLVDPRSGASRAATRCRCSTPGR